MNKPLSNMLTDVSIREGGQQAVDLRHSGVDTKLDFMSLAVGSGVKHIELTAFAPGPWFSDAESLVRRAAPRLPENVSLRALYFNTKGLADLMKHPRIMREGIFLTAATAKYREKNYGQKSIEHAEIKIKRLIDAFKKNGLEFDTLVMSTAWGECDEASPEDSTLSYLGRLLSSAEDLGSPVHSVTLADTMGCAAPDAIGRLVKQVKQKWPGIMTRVHLHPAPGTAEECILAALEAGVEHWEASWCGLGGSPMADAAGGNLDIRHLIRVYNRLRMVHGFEEEVVLRMIHFLKKHTQRAISNIQL